MDFQPPRTEIAIPNFLADWPWAYAVNPHFKDVQRESNEWLFSFTIIKPERRASFLRGEFDLLTAMANPTCSREHLRISMDFINFLFLFDDFTDPLGQADVKIAVETVRSALRSPDTPRPDDEPVVGEMARQFWARARHSLNGPVEHHFLRTLDNYLQSVYEEAGDRDQGKILDVAAYIMQRRDTGAVPPTFALLEPGLYLSEEAFTSAPVVELVNMAVDMITFPNDLFSYNKERLSGNEGHNLITVLMREERTDIHGAIRRLTEQVNELKRNFIAKFHALPAVDEALVRYIEALGMWIAANDHWSFLSTRYFGSKGADIRAKGVMVLTGVIRGP